jgi:hypothetical protein
MTFFVLVARVKSTYWHSAKQIMSERTTNNSVQKGEKSSIQNQQSYKYIMRIWIPGKRRMMPKHKYVGASLHTEKKGLIRIGSYSLREAFVSEHDKKEDSATYRGAAPTCKVIKSNNGLASLQYPHVADPIMPGQGSKGKRRR